MSRVKVYILSFLLLACPASDAQQQKYQYNLNSYNGLPSGNAYCLFRDSYGYLWIGTDDGVVRYDGYTTKLYNMSTGLADADVWDFYEDRKGRIWLSRISGEFGYIHHGRYRKVLVTGDPNIQFYPRYITEHKNGIMFLSTERAYINLCVEENDTLHVRRLTDWPLTGKEFIAPDGKVLRSKDGELYEVTKKGAGFELRLRCSFNRYSAYQLTGNYLMPHPDISIDKLFALDIRTCKELELKMHRGSNIYNQYVNKGKYYIVTDRHAYISQAGLENISTHRLGEYLNHGQLANNTVAYIIEDDFWGSCVATSRGGVFMCFDMPYFTIDKRHGMERYRYAGKDNSGVSYWWSKEKFTLKSFPGGVEESSRYSGVIDIERIAEDKKRGILLFTKRNLYIYDRNNKSITSFFRNIRHHVYISDSNSSRFVRHIEVDDNYNFQGIQYGIFDANGLLHSIRRGIGYTISKVMNDTLLDIHMADGRFKDMLYDSARSMFIVYGDNQVTIHSKDTLYTLDAHCLKKCGLLRVERILLDNGTGDIFIKDYNRIFRCSFRNSSYMELHKNRKLEGAEMCLYNGILITAGKFGVSFSRVTKGRDMPGVTYPNVKGLAYNKIFGLTVVNDTLLVNTDSGLISMPFPADSEYHNNISSIDAKQRYTVNYRNKILPVKGGDTLRLNQNNRSMRIDLINPEGVGKPVYKAFIKKINKSWDTLNANEVYLAGLDVGTYYTMLVKAEDEIWKGPQTALMLYIVPTFWQTAAGRTITWIGIALLTIAILFITIYYTGKTVTRKHERKNYLLSLELRSIYAQINPHFIFNTLNTGLYFISENKNDDAFRHISSFSGLLRAYIRSVRNKYISLSEEIENLENYIILQQYRFENKFRYQVNIDEEVDTTRKIVPALLLQPFVENAINHGLLNKEGEGHLAISFMPGDEEEIVCTIEDDGIGRKRSAELKQENEKTGGSYGNALIKDLVEIINAEGKIYIKIQYIDKPEPFTGTKVIITIKTIPDGK